MVLSVSSTSLAVLCEKDLNKWNCLKIECPKTAKGEVMNVVNAVYGRLDAEICAYDDPDMDLNCSASNSLKIVRKRSFSLSLRLFITIIK